MNVAYFILIVILISFATGFFVAAIIWMIKWSILAGENKELLQTNVFQHFSKLFQNKYQKNEHPPLSTNNDSLNMELYQYYHGKN
jgi:hypothetical protein